MTTREGRAIALLIPNDAQLWYVICMNETTAVTKTHIKTKIPGLWRVVLHNDDYTPMDFVVAVLIQIFQKNINEARSIMLTVHIKGRAQVGLYTLEIAMQKVSEVMHVAEINGHPLLATSEES